MKSFKNIILGSIASLMAGMFYSCTNEFIPVSDSDSVNPELITMLRAEVSIANESPTPGTRLTLEPDDQWTYAHSSFVKGDTVGVFARQGNMNLMTSDGKGGPLINVPMHFVEQTYLVDPNKPDGATETKYTLENDTVFIMPTSMNNLGVMMYYPYSANMGNLRNYPGWKDYPSNPSNETGKMIWGGQYPDIPGIELRTLAPDGSIRCKDVLHMYQANYDDLKKGLLRGTFYHLFNEIVILRGQGFDNPMQKIENGDGTFSLVPNEDIYVVYTEPVSHIRPVSIMGTNVYWGFQLYYEDGYVFNGESMGDEEASRWKAWKGNNYPTKPTETNPAREAWYVVIPSVYRLNDSKSYENNQQYSIRPTVKELLVYDNNGYLQHITNLELKANDDTSTSSKQPYPSRKYIVEIKMDELGPTVRPVSISDWNREGDDKDITEVRSAGINNEDDYDTWATAYNSYITAGRAESYIEELRKFGDMIDGGKMWNFYISPFTFTHDVPVVYDLQDQIIGNNNFFNIEFKNLSLTHPLFNMISHNGGISNIDFVSPSLNVSSKSSVGILAGSVTSESGANPGVVFSNVNISFGKVVNQGSGGVGVFAGSISGGTIDGCTISGQPLGRSSASDAFEGLFGETPTVEPKITDSDYNGIIFSTYNGGGE